MYVYQTVYLFFCFSYVDDNTVGKTETATPPSNIPPSSTSTDCQPLPTPYHHHQTLAISDIIDQRSTYNERKKRESEYEAAVAEVRDLIESREKKPSCISSQLGGMFHQHAQSSSGLGPRLLPTTPSTSGGNNMPAIVSPTLAQDDPARKNVTQTAASSSTNEDEEFKACPICKGG